MIEYTPEDWYWRVLAEGELYASARRMMVAETDADYLAFVARGGAATRIVSMDELKAVLAAQCPAAVPVDLAAYAAEKRWQLETSGIEINGLPVATGRESQALIHGAFTLAQADSAAEFRFKGEAGFVTLNAVEMIAIGERVARHVQDCFGWEADMLAGIAAGDVASEADIEASAASFTSTI